MAAEIISTPKGKIKGKTIKLKDGKPVHVFRNVPFAKPPIGKLRFMPPEPAEPWEEVRDCTAPGNKPVYDPAMEAGLKSLFPTQELEGPEPPQDEDCLHLSIYTPCTDEKKKMAVMVWLYGGGFQMGCELMYDGTVLAGMNDVVVVVPNYRVGIFGFLTLCENSPCTGNAGLMDQQMALRWVQENISCFGGDKDRVTIFGESAGGCSVHLNVLSPTAKGLFHRAISHSGTAQMADSQTPRKNLRLIREHLKIEGDNQKLLDTLQNFTAKELVDTTNALFAQMVYYAPFADGKVLPKTTRQLMEEKNFSKVPYMVGCNDSESSGLLCMGAGKDFAGGLTEEEARKAILLPLDDEGYELCKKEYLREEHGDIKFSKMVANLVGDGFFVAPAVETATFHSDSGADTYCYLGAFQLKMHHDKEYGPEVGKKVDWCRCDHGDDIYMTFGEPFSPSKLTLGAKFSKEEEKLSRTFMTYLTNFAKTGDPNKGEKVPVHWPKYKKGGEHLVVDIPFTIRKNISEKAVKFWTEVMPEHTKREDE